MIANNRLTLCQVTCVSLVLFQPLYDDDRLCYILPRVFFGCISAHRRGMAPCQRACDAMHVLKPKVHVCLSRRHLFTDREACPGADFECLSKRCGDAFKCVNTWMRYFRLNRKYTKLPAHYIVNSYEALTKVHSDTS